MYMIIESFKFQKINHVEDVNWLLVVHGNELKCSHTSGVCVLKMVS